MVKILLVAALGVAAAGRPPRLRRRLDACPTLEAVAPEDCPPSDTSDGGE